MATNAIETNAIDANADRSGGSRTGQPRAEGFPADGLQADRATDGMSGSAEAICWWNDGELPMVGKGADGLIYVVSTFLQPGGSASCVGCVRGPSLDEVLGTFARGLAAPAGPARWVSHDEYPAGSLRQGAMAHKVRAEEAASRTR